MIAATETTGPAFDWQGMLNELTRNEVLSAETARAYAVRTFGQYATIYDAVPFVDVDLGFETENGEVYSVRLRFEGHARDEFLTVWLERSYGRLVVYGEV